MNKINLKYKGKEFYYFEIKKDYDKCYNLNKEKEPNIIGFVVWLPYDCDKLYARYINSEQNFNDILTIKQHMSIDEMDFDNYSIDYESIRIASAVERCSLIKYNLKYNKLFYNETLKNWVIEDDYFEKSNEYKTLIYDNGISFIENNLFLPNCEPYILDEQQKEYLENIQTFNTNIVTKYRNSGLTTLSCAYSLYLCSLYHKKPLEIVFIVINSNHIQELINNIKDLYKTLPSHFTRIDKDKSHKGNIIFENGNKIKILSSGNLSKVLLSNLNLIDYLFLDETAFFNEEYSLFECLKNKLNTDSKIISYSTIKNQEKNNLFNKQIINCINNSDMNLMQFKWWRDKRFNDKLEYDEVRHQYYSPWYHKIYQNYTNFLSPLEIQLNLDNDLIKFI